MIIVAFSGKKDSGKDTGANHLAAHYLQKYNPRNKPKILGMSYPLKKFCSQWFGLPLKNLNGTDELKNKLTHLFWEDLPAEARGDRVGPMSHREVLQVWGTDLLRRADPEVHCRRWGQEAEEMRQRGHPLLFVTDVRFPNEVEALLRFPEARVIRLTRHPYPDDTHASEMGLDNFDWTADPRLHVLDNTESEEQYKKDLVKWFETTFMEQLP